MKPETSVFVHGKLPSLNEYVDACRVSRYKANSMKRETEQLIYMQTLRLTKITGKVRFLFIWYEETERRDPDNVAFAKKFIFDALQKNGKIPNDNARYIGGFSDDFVYGKGQGVLIEVKPYDR